MRAHGTHAHMDARGLTMLTRSPRGGHGLTMPAHDRFGPMARVADMADVETAIRVVKSRPRPPGRRVRRLNTWSGMARPASELYEEYVKAAKAAGREPVAPSPFGCALTFWGATRHKTWDTKTKMMVSGWVL